MTRIRLIVDAGSTPAVSDCDVTDEIEKALWRLKDDLDLPTEEIELAVDSRKKLKGETND